MIFRRTRRALYRIRFKPGDTAILELADRTYNAAQIQEMARLLKAALPEGVQAIIVFNGSLRKRRRGEA